MNLKTKCILYQNSEQYEKEFADNVEACKREMQAAFEEDKEPIIVCAPGRVNLIGEHTDYNEGFVFPMAIPLFTVIAGAKNNCPKRICRIKSLEPSLGSNNVVEFSLDDLKPLDAPFKWANYLIGVISLFKGTKEPFNAVVKSNVPLGSGLSSSAALEVATFTFLENLSNEFSDKKEKALTCQQAEHKFANVPCGVMDQFISTMGKKNHAVLIDCRSLESQEYLLKNPDVSILIINSNVKHSLEGSEYSSRREQCNQVSESLGKKSLRESNIQELNENADSIDKKAFQRAKHVITEISRTVEASKSLENNDIIKFGKLMNESHDSLRDDFNVSCAELDSLVEICRSNSGVYGSRMTGGGFGGCTVTLLKKDAVNDVIKSVQDNYDGIPSFYVCTPCDGAKRVN